MTVLNPLLYRRLERVFGGVRVGNPGMPMSAQAMFDLASGRPRLSFTERGEHYRVCCCYCGDSRFRLSINHRWGDFDAHGRVMNFLANCFNNDCLADPATLENFIDRLSGPTLAPLRPVRTAPLNIEREPPELPGPVTRIDQLPTTHPAAAYLLSRHFDLQELAVKYQVSVCTRSRYRLVTDRVLAPVYYHRRLAGWQARYPGELNWKECGIPKYFSDPNMSTSRVLYNFDRARRWRTVVLCEGVTDVWSFGSMAMATFGKTIGDVRVRDLAAALSQQTLVLLYDPEEQGKDATQRVIDRLRQAFGRRLAVVWLPEGSDPGSLDRGFLREYIRVEAAKQNVPVIYRLAQEVAR